MILFFEPTQLSVLSPQSAVALYQLSLVIYAVP
jgi:hypothetical protein